MEVIFTDRFLNRVKEFSDYNALDNIPKAVACAEDIFSNCQKLQDNPNMGRMVAEFRRPEIRELIHGNYRLIHEVKTSQVDMLTILAYKSTAARKIRRIMTVYLTHVSTRTLRQFLLRDYFIATNYIRQ